MSRWTANNFIHVADKLEDKWRNFHHLPISVLYELAAPSTSEEILAQVQAGYLPPALEAVKEAKEAERIAREAERQARVEVERIQEQFSALPPIDLFRHVAQKIQSRFFTMDVTPFSFRD